MLALIVGVSRGKMQVSKYNIAVVDHSSALWHVKDYLSQIQFYTALYLTSR